jgi:ketosteroid isomerase-like protein
VRAWLAATRRDWKTVTITYDHIRETGPGCVVAVGRVTASSADGTANVDRPLACVAEFRDGRLVRARVFADADEALRYAHSAAPR